MNEFGSSKAEVVAPLLEEEKIKFVDPNDLSVNWQGEFKKYNKRGALDTKVLENSELESEESAILKLLEKKSIKLVNTFWKTSHHLKDEEEKSLSLESNTNKHFKKFKLYLICACIFLICLLFIFVFYRRR